MLTTLIQFFLSLSILVILHELGHFGAAKYFKTRVEKFYLFFNPGFTIFKIQKGETEYGLGWLPFGGYVKISGMIDESFDKDQMKGEPQPWEFRSKPAWQRLIIMVGGVTVNFILGITIFIALLWNYGETYIPNDQIKYGIAVDSIAYEIGLRDGDKLISIGDHKFEKFNPRMITKELVFNGATNLLVNRDGIETVIDIDPKYVQELTKYENRNVDLAFPRFPYIIDYIEKSSPGEKANLKLGDRIIGINDIETLYSHEFVKAQKEITSDNVSLSVLRNRDTLNMDIALDENGRIGITSKALDHFVALKKQNYSLSQAIPGGWNKSWNFLTDQIKAFGQMFTGKIKAKDSLGSFITIGKMFGTDWDGERFWSMTAMLSLLLGFINLLPIPALDGGYVMFLLFESITGIKVPDRVMEIATLIGFGLLIILMIYALGLDISRLF